MSKGLHGLAAFSHEQSLQLFLKSKLLGKGGDYPRTHSARRLLELLSEVTVGPPKRATTALLDRYLLELGTLEDAYITSRYLLRDFRNEEVERLGGAVKEMMEALKDDC